MDFTYKIYTNLLKSIISKGYKFITFKEYVITKISGSPLPSKFIILRHDVELRYENAYYMANIQSELGIRASYYFRIHDKKKNEEFIKKIAELGHEIGYHYDDLSRCNGNVENALKRFKKNLTYFRQFGEVSTISMEGAPLSKYDNRDLWNYADYHKFGILGEPYFDIDFSKVFYITDTGRMWNGHKYNLRDKPLNNKELSKEFNTLKIHSTQDLIRSIENDVFPKSAMLTFHPQRWHNNHFSWSKELILQTIKNQAKRILIKIRK